MKKSVMQKWVKALRSGKYKQGTGYLKQRSPGKKTQYCCLGVLCEILGAEWQPDPLHATRKVYSLDDRGDPTNSNLPFSIKEAAGMCSPNGWLPDDRNLIDMNDIGGKSFKEIADIIEKEYRKL